jgi:integrase
MARGSIQKTTNGSYRLRVELAPDPSSGKRRWHSETLATKRRAESRLAELLAESAEDRYSKLAYGKLADYLTGTWLPYYRTHVRQSTFVIVESHCRRHIVPHIGNLRLNAIRSLDMHAWHETLREKGLRPSTIRAVHGTLSLSLEQASRFGILRNNPIRGAHAPKPPRRPATLWSAEETASFLSYIEGTTLHTIVCTFGATGMRRGELLALRWTDINFDEGTIHIQRTITRQFDLSWTIGPPKSEQSLREIAIPDELVALLRNHKRDQDRRRQESPLWSTEDWVFDRGDGEMLSTNQLEYMWSKAIRESGLPAIRKHDLRHGAATAMLEAGIPLKVISEHLGHASVAITADVYQHVTKTMQRQAADTLRGFIKKPD